MKTTKVFETTDSTCNLCDYCHFNIPDCTPRIKFGDGLGFDNVIGCTAFSGEVDGENIVERDISDEELNQLYED